MSETRSTRLKRKGDELCSRSGMKKKLSTENNIQADFETASASIANPPDCSVSLRHPHVKRRCTIDFYKTSCIDLARSLLGCVLSSFREGKMCKGIIVETEAYLGGEDLASHSYAGKKTARNAAMFMDPGTAYVYSIYGMHHCFNVSSQGEGAAVLVRALEPVEGVEEMQARRGGKNAKDLCNGPAKLCKSFGIDKSCDKLDLVTSNTLWIELGEGLTDEIIVTKRIGVDYAGEWAKKPLRFYVSGNKA